MSCRSLYPADIISKVFICLDNESGPGPFFGPLPCPPDHCLGRAIQYLFNNFYTMKYWLPAPVFALLFSSGLTAQAVAPSVIASDGGSGTAGSVRIDYTLGELAVDGLTGQRVSMTEGFHQPILRIERIEDASPTPDDSALPAEERMVTLTPNPVTAEFAVRFHADAPKAVAIDVFDAQGILILRHRPDPALGDTHVDMSPFAAGLYHVQITAAEPRSISTYTIVKIQ